MFLRYMTRVNRRQANAQQIRVSIYIYTYRWYDNKIIKRLLKHLCYSTTTMLTDIKKKRIQRKRIE